MNILIFVMALLMLMASITYSSLNRFVKAEVQAHEWQERIRAQARVKYNQSLYALSKPKVKEEAKPPEPKKEDKKAEKPKAEMGKGIIPGQFLLNPSFRQQHPDDLIKYGELFKAVARQLYFEQPFFKNLEKDRPQFLDEIMREIVEISERGKPIANFNKLMFEKWSDPNLKRAFSLMLAESPSYRKPVKVKIEKDDEEKEKEESIINRNGIITLNDYFHFIYKDKIRLWLAPKPVLIALFRNSELVDALMQDRKQNYPKLISGIYERDDLEKYLHETYGGKSAYETFIDYTVTKTRPPK